MKSRLNFVREMAFSSQVENDLGNNALCTCFLWIADLHNRHRDTHEHSVLHVSHRHIDLQQQMFDIWEHTDLDVYTYIHNFTYIYICIIYGDVYICYLYVNVYYLYLDILRSPSFFRTLSVHFHVEFTQVSGSAFKEAVNFELAQEQLFGRPSGSG